MQREKRDRRQFAADRTVEVILPDLCLAASIYGLTRISAGSGADLKQGTAMNTTSSSRYPIHLSHNLWAGPHPA